MAKDQDTVGLSPTVTQVLDQFFADARGGSEIPEYAMDRLEVLLRSEKIPKPDDLNAALFAPPPEDEQ